MTSGTHYVNCEHIPERASPEIGNIHSITYLTGRTRHIPKTCFGEAHDIPEIGEAILRLCDSCNKSFVKEMEVKEG